MKHNKALLTSVFIIVAVNAASHFFLGENKNHINVRYEGYGLSFLYIIFVGLIGYAGWRKYPVTWPCMLWVLMYSAAFCILGAIRLTDKFIFRLPATLIVVVHSSRDVFNSPMPFLILYILVRYIVKPVPAQNEPRP